MNVDVSSMFSSRTAMLVTSVHFPGIGSGIFFMILILQRSISLLVSALRMNGSRVSQ